MFRVSAKTGCLAKTRTALGAALDKQKPNDICIQTANHVRKQKYKARL